ncbi:hypothetical protein LCGC14_1359730 [marine sediment metagenome]|uniref:Methyltransferase domain-containing protein n=1 Tax=marine sediment metagenome TaxID=412755 RepID=A0A0F9KUI9_9ZZZZ
MDPIRIGGHLGMDVSRSPGGVITKTALHDIDNGQMTGNAGLDLYDHNAVALANAVRILDMLRGARYAPEVIDSGDGWVIEEDMGVTEPVKDAEAFRRNCVTTLAAIRAAGIRHGDLNGPNIIIRDDEPKLVDWTEAHLLDEVAPQKSPYSDSNLLWRTVAGTIGPDGNYDTPRIARRWLAVLGALGAVTDLTLPLRGKTFLDLGCFQGDFVAAAAAEGMDAVGLDMGGFRSGENSISIGKDLWAGFPFGTAQLHQGNIMDLRRRFRYDVVMMFSTWPYLESRQAAFDLLGNILADCGTFFFETQLSGDGPGPAFLETDSDVEAMLTRYGQVTHLTRIPVTGRPASRSVWKVVAR